jgi:exopolysaccharide biosynthesis protein
MTLIVYSLIGGSSAEAELAKSQNSGVRIETRNFATANVRPLRSDEVVQGRILSVQSEVRSQEIKSAEVQKIEESNKQQRTNIQQGQEILLNGRRLTVAWTQWQKGNSDRIGMSDTGAMQTLGVELLNTTQTNSQPVLWFPADPSRPISLEARLIGSYRYIDITELMQQAGAQMQVVGNLLKIELPQPKILDVRVGNQTWGKRLVIDLDRPVFWQTSQAPNQGAVIIEGIATPELLARFQPVSVTANVRQNSDEDDLGSGSTTHKKGDRIFSLKNDGKVTKLLVELPTAYGIQVFSLSNPNRLVVDVRANAMKPKEIAWAPGITWRQQYISLNRGIFPVNWLEIDPRSPGVSIKPITSNPNTLEGTAPIVTTARSQQAAAAINGGFFNRNNKLPLGAIRANNRWLSSPILNRGAIAWDDKGQIKIGRLSLQETLITSTGTRLPILYLNSGYVQAGMARYTPEWGMTYKPLSDNETIIEVQNNRITGQVKAGRGGKDTFAIPADGYLLAIRKNGIAAAALTPGTQVNIENNTNPAEFATYPQILGAGPLLIQDGRIVLNAASEQFSKGFGQQMASRSAIATTNRGTIIITAIHNRVGGRGATLAELAQILQKIGATNALNLDGGSSTSLSLGGQLIDRSPVTAARVHNGIGIFLSQ